MARKRGETKSRQQSAAPTPYQLKRAAVQLAEGVLREESAAPASAPTVRPAGPDDPQAIIGDAIRLCELVGRMGVVVDTLGADDEAALTRHVAELPGRLQRLDAELKVLRAGTVWPIIPDRPAHTDELLDPTPKAALMRATDDMDLAIYTLRQAAEALGGLELWAGDDAPKVEFWRKALEQRSDELNDSLAGLTSWFCTAIREARG